MPYVFDKVIDAQVVAGIDTNAYTANDVVGGLLTFNVTSPSNVGVINKLVIADDDNEKANHNRFWGNGETWGYTGKSCAFSIYHSFHGGVDQRRRVHRVFIVKENYDEGVKECFKALADYSGKSFTNIKHPANALLFAP